ncbi:DUF4279 domain-containing protein [Streptomyces lydicus]|uniref:DUF4279 domain-containing protein n=1 Tax=Streptomyces lydicus TaxID=47763 RepID=UPI00332C73CF
MLSESDEGLAMESDASMQAPQDWVLTDVALIIKSPGLDSTMLTRCLGITPTLVVEPGTDPRDPAGEWRFQCDERTTRDFRQQLDIVLSSVEPKQGELQRLSSGGYDVHLRVYGFTHDEAFIGFSHEEWERISGLGVSLELAPNTNAR